MALSLTGSSTAAGMPSFQLQAARREARQAEQTARALGAQAQAAQRSADQEQARADGLSSQAADANQRSDAARKNLAATDSGSTPFANARGQKTGLLLDTFA
jgi:type II secretory pathway pseudopilin PulG